MYLSSESAPPKLCSGGDPSQALECPVMQACALTVRFLDEQSGENKRSDSGIADSESDFESSYNSSPRSSLGSSMDSANYSGKFPPLSEIVTSTPCENSKTCGSNCESNGSEKLTVESTTPENGSETSKSESTTPENGSETSKSESTAPKSPVKVQMGVIFAVN